MAQMCSFVTWVSRQLNTHQGGFELNDRYKILQQLLQDVLLLVSGPVLDLVLILVPHLSLVHDARYGACHA